MTPSDADRADRSDGADGAGGVADAPPCRLHRLTLVFEAVRIGRAFIAPAVVGALGASGGDPGRTIGIGLAILAVPALLAALARYHAFRYCLAVDELIIDAGVLSRSRRVIPLARIQNIDLRQNWAQRLAGVAELRVETAGGTRTEAVLSVLTRRDAEALRAELLQRRSPAPAAVTAAAVAPAAAGGAGGGGGGGGAGSAGVDPTGATYPTPATGPTDRPHLAHPPLEPLVRLSAGDLALGGATANEAGLVAAVLAGGLQFLDPVLDRIEPLDFGPIGTVPGEPAFGIALAAGGLVVAILVMGWLISVVGALVGYHGFTLERSATEIRKRYGLLDRREATVPIGRVQLVRIEESLLRRPLGLAALRIETAGGAPGERRRGGAEAFVPLARTADVPRLVGAVFADLDTAALRFRPVHPRARRRQFTRYMLKLVPAALAVAFVVGPPGLLLLALLPAAFIVADREVRHRGYALAPGYVAARAGFFNRVTWIVPEGKVQTLHVRQSPLQRRHALATMIVDTAGGGRSAVARVIDLGEPDAAGLLAALAGRIAAR